MNWQKISIERLRDYEARKQASDSISEQLESLEQSFSAIRTATIDAIPIRGGGGNTREHALINNIAMREELKRNFAIVQSEIKTTERGLEVLTAEQRHILDRFYINHMRGHVEDLCNELHIERSRVYALKDEALKRFTIACYGLVEI